MTDVQKVTARNVAIYAVVVIGAAFGTLAQAACPPMTSYIQIEFGVDANQTQLLTTSYMMVMGVIMPITTFLMKRFTYRQVATSAFLFQIAGALLTAVSPNFAVALIGRIIYAVASGILMPMVMAMCMLVFPPNRRATAMGFAGIAFGFCPNFGPTVGGLFAQAGIWRMFFWMAAGVGLLTLVLGWFVINTKEANYPDTKLDFLSVIYSSIGFGGLLMGFSNASSMGFAVPLSWVPIVLGAIFVVLFIYRQKHCDNPLINFDMFNFHPYTPSFICVNLMQPSFMAIPVILPLFITTVWGGTAIEAGLAFLPSSIAAIVINPISGLLTDKFGYRKVMTTGYIIMLTGSVGMMFINETTPLALIMLCQCLRGIGVSTAINGIAVWGMQNLPANFMSDGSSFNSATRMISASLVSSISVLIVSLVGTWLGNVVFAYQITFFISVVLCASCLFIVLRYCTPDTDQIAK